MLNCCAVDVSALDGIMYQKDEAPNRWEMGDRAVDTMDDNLMETDNTHKDRIEQQATWGVSVVSTLWDRNLMTASGFRAQELDSPRVRLGSKGMDRDEPGWSTVQSSVRNTFLK